MLRKISIFASRLLSVVAFSSVKVASPFWQHREKAPEELLRK